MPIAVEASTKAALQLYNNTLALTCRRVST